MFIFNLTYIKPLTEAEKFLQKHIAFLDKYYEKNVFICSGRKIPRTGGVILCNCETQQEAEEIMQDDPFYKEKIAQYEIIEFIPSKACDDFKCLIKGNK